MSVCKSIVCGLWLPTEYCKGKRHIQITALALVFLSCNQKSSVTNPKIQSSFKISKKSVCSSCAATIIAYNTMMRNLTIEDKRGSWFHPHLSVDQVRSACFLGAALTRHQLGYMGRLTDP